MVFKVVVEAEVLGYEADLGFGDIAFVVMVEWQLQLGKAVQQLKRNFLEEDCAFTIELRCNSQRRPPRKWQDGSLVRVGWCQRLCLNRRSRSRSRWGWDNDVIRVSSCRFHLHRSIYPLISLQTLNSNYHPTPLTCAAATASFPSNLFY